MPDLVEKLVAFTPTLVNIAVLVGVIAALRQVTAAKSALKAQTLLKLYDDWRDPNLYKATIYIYQLLAEWSAYPVSEWPHLAKDWVEVHAGQPTDSKEWKEWELRRTLSQFLAKMGLLIEAGYLTDDEFFSVNLEAGRQLAVLTYIEIAVQDHWHRKAHRQIAPWDHSFPKYEFNALWTRYEWWYKKHGTSKKFLALPKFADQIPNKQR